MKYVHKYKIELEANERKKLLSLISKGKAKAKKLLAARVLLKADHNQPGEVWGSDKIADAFDSSQRTVIRIKKRYVEGGLERALNRKKHSRTKPKKITGVEEAKLIALACSKPPKGRKAWSLKLLANKLVELKVFESISSETVRRSLKKTRSNHG